MTTHLSSELLWMYLLFHILMKIPISIYMRSLIMKDKKKNDLLSYLFVLFSFLHFL